MKRILWIALAALLVAACGGKKSRPAQSSARPAPRTFRAVTVPSTVPPEERKAYLRDHYWDNFDFRDTTLLAEVDTVAMVRALFAYVANFVAPDDRAAIDTLMRRASASKPMTEYFAMLAERVLHDPNSPARNDELYIPVLEALVSSPWLDRWERIAPQHDLRMASQNRIGRPANDFRYTLASGATGTLYGVKAEYTLLFINNPGCHACTETIDALKNAPIINRLLGQKKLTVLSIYPDEELDEWRKHLNEFPKEWINGYDKKFAIKEQQLYDLKAIPTLYLLNKEKTVLLKDATAQAIEEYLTNVELE